MLHKAYRKSHEGYTLMEMAIVLGIIGVFVGAVWAAASQVFADKNAQQAYTQTTQIVNGYRQLYSTHGIDTINATDVTCLGVNANLFPTEMVPAATAAFCLTDTTNVTPSPPLTTPWGGTTSLTILSNQNPAGVKVAFTNLSIAACEDLANVMTNSPDVIWEYINGAAQYISVVQVNTPFTSKQIAIYCERSNQSSLTVMFKVK